MGVIDVWNHVRHEPIDSTKLRGKTLAVDVNIWLNESVRGSVTNRSRCRAPHLATLLNRFLALKAIGVNPIAVFDGHNIPPEKQRKRKPQRSLSEVLQQGDGKQSSTSRISRNDSHSGHESLIYTQSFELLSYLGVPVVKAPGEAEAQCAWLERHNVVDGTVTSDFDYFLFGGSHLYKANFERVCPTFLTLSMQQLEDGNFTSGLSLNRSRLIALGLLLGCDYTDGVKKVGFVNGCEILATLDKECSKGPKEILNQFWAVCNSIDVTNEEHITRWRNLGCEFEHNFLAVIPKLCGYFESPDVNVNIPNLSVKGNEAELKTFVMDKLHWTLERIELELSRHKKRVVKRRQDLKNYFPVIQSPPKPAPISASKRIEKAAKRPVAKAIPIVGKATPTGVREDSKRIKLTKKRPPKVAFARRAAKSPSPSLAKSVPKRKPVVVASRLHT